MKHSLWLASLAILVVAGFVHADAPKPARAKSPPHGAKSVDIDYTWKSFQSDKWHAKLTWNGAAYESDDKRIVDPRLVDALYASLTALHDETDSLSCMSHTDDYPAFAITIDGDEPVTIASSSNCHAYVPWNITQGGKQLAQFDGSVWAALSPLLSATADRWKQGGNSPMASMSTGGERVELGEYAKTGGTFSSHAGDAPACAHSLEGSLQARSVFGDALSVDELSLGCDLGTSADCSAPVAEATLLWQGLTARVELACTKGTVSLPAPVIDKLTELSAFVASKPVRMLVKLATSPPRLWLNRAWSVEAEGTGLPTLRWRPGTKTIGARTAGESPAAAYWKPLGIDPAKLVTQHDGFTEMTVELDFAGKRVK